MAYGTLNAGTITPGSGNTLAISEAVTVPTPTATTHAATKAYVDSAATQATTAAQGVGTGDSPTFAGIKVPGVVVNVAYDEFTSGSQSLGGWDYLSNGTSDLNVTPTAKGTNSMYILIANFRVNLSTTTNVSIYARFTNGTGVIGNEFQFLYNNLSGERRFMQTVFGRWNSSISAGTALNIRLQMSKTNGTPSIQGDGTTLTVMEVAQ